MTKCQLYSIMSSMQDLRLERAEEARLVFGHREGHEPLVDTSDLVLNHAVALEIAERLCVVDAGMVSLEFSHTAQRLVSDKFYYDTGTQTVPLRLGLVHRMDTYFDNAERKPVEEVQVLFVKDEADGTEIHSVVGSVRHNRARVAHDTTKASTPKSESLDEVMSCILAANESLS